MTLTFSRQDIDDAEPVTTVEPKDATPVDPAGANILVVSENRGICKMLSHVLGSEPGAKTTVIESSLSDFQHASTPEDRRYDIIVFEAKPNDEDELRALTALKQELLGDTKLLALATEGLNLATARQLMEVGIDEVLPLSSIRPELRTALSLSDDVEQIVSGTDADKRGKVISIAQARGGVGATMTAVNLARELVGRKKRRNAPEPKKVALVDFDLQRGSITDFLDLDPNNALVDLIKKPSAPGEVFFAAALQSLDCGVDVLCAPSEMVPMDALHPQVVADMLDELRARYDYVVIDMPTVVVTWLEPLLERTDRMLLTTDTSVPSIRQAKRLLDTYTEDHFSLAIDIVICGEKKPFSLSAPQKEASAILDRPLTHWIPRDDKAARRAVDLGQPLAEAAPRSSMTKAYRGLADAVLKSQLSENA